MIAQAMYQEESHGMLLNWTLELDAKPCVARPRWEKLAMPPVDFSPRRQHTAVAVDSSIFITGGLSERRLDDLWRFGLESDTWTELKSDSRRDQLPLNGQVAYLGNFGVLGYGGLAAHGPRKQGHDLWILDLFESEWMSVPVPQSLNGRDGYFK